MYTHVQKLSTHETGALRAEAGRLLKSLREKAGYSQRSFAKQVGSPAYTFVSQIECGRGRLPPDQIRVWARAYGIRARDLAQMIMRFYDPETFAVLYDEQPEIMSGTAFPELIAIKDGRAGSNGAAGSA